ncbi:MAG: hypothetical protein RL148_2453 [Planctomycetota bacterium]
MPLDSRPPAFPRMRRLRLLYPWYGTTSGISGCATHFLDALEANPELRARFAPEHWLTTANPAVRRAYQRQLYPHVFGKVLHRVATQRWLSTHVVRRYARSARSGDVAWLFPSVEAPVYREMRERGCFVVKELINTALGAHRDSLVRAHEVLGWEPGVLPPFPNIEEERQQLPHAHVFFSCSPQVTRTFVEAGADPARMVETSYAWSPEEFRPRRTPHEGFRFLFVAAGSVRKGLPHLLLAWERARVDATLVVVGRLDTVVEQRCGALLRGPRIEYHPWTRDLAGVYSGADAFVLPSFEEGSPLVSYLALAAGLPCLMTPESAGWVVRDGIEGLHAPAGDTEAWAQLLRRCVEDRELVQRLAANAAPRAAEYTWAKVMERRCKALLERLAAAGQ